jgi:hypothetical protein
MYLIKEHIRNIIGNMLGTKSFKPKNLQVLLQNPLTTNLLGVTIVLYVDIG